MILESLKRAFASIFRGKIFLIVCIPSIVTIFFWIILLIIFWKALIGITETGISDTFLVSIPTWIINLVFSVEPMVVANFIATAIVLFLSIPMMYLSNLLLVAVVLMPFLLPAIAKEDYPQLEKKMGGSFIGSLVNSIWASGVFFIAVIISLPLWLVPGMTLVLPMILNGYLNQKVFLYDALQDFADKDERKILKKQFWERYGLGVVTAFLNYIPVVNFFSAAITALCFIHFAFISLEAHRKNRA